MGYCYGIFRGCLDVVGVFWPCLFNVQVLIIADTSTFGKFMGFREDHKRTYISLFTFGTGIM